MVLRAALIVLALLGLQGRAEAGGHFTLRLKGYINRYGEVKGHGYCDWGKTRLTPCDLYFEIHYQLGDAVRYPTVFTRTWHESDSVTFGDEINVNTSSAIRQRFAKWLGNFSLRVEVMDDDRLTLPDHVDTIRSTVSLPPDGEDHSYRVPGLIPDFNSNFSYAIRAACDKFFYPPTCEKYCRPKDHGVCRYWCDSNGDKRCLEGWRNPAGGCCECYCHNGGSCRVTADNFTCSCPAGWTGPMCEHHASACGPAPSCRNGGICTNITGSFGCVCPRGFRGKACEEDVDECRMAPAPCKSPKLCVNTPGSFLCSCPQGFTGEHCDEDVDECAAAPPVCLHGGVCANTRGSFKCHCGRGFAGRTCAQDVDECKLSPPPCEGRVCENTVGSFKCRCRPGYLGAACDDIDECSADPPACKNNGRCTNTDGSFVCSCPDGVRGDTCARDVDECEEGSHRCRNGASCVNSYGGYKCLCPPGFSGSSCETEAHASSKVVAIVVSCLVVALLLTSLLVFKCVRGRACYCKRPWSESAARYIHLSPDLGGSVDFSDPYGDPWTTDSHAASDATEINRTAREAHIALDV